MQSPGEAEPALNRRARRSHPLDVGRGRAHPRTSGVVEPALRRRARRSQPSVVGRGGACPQPLARRSPPSDVGRGRASPQPSSRVEPTLSRRARWSLAIRGRARWNQSSVVRARSVVAFLSDRKRQRSMVINSTSLDTPVLGPRQ